MFTASQIVAHLVGDYLIQSHWMATEKTRRHTAAALHAVTYALPFLFLTRSVPALALIVGTHFVIDRYRLARFVVWLKNWSYDDDWGPQWQPTVTATGYPEDCPAWLAVWLLIIADNTLHLLCNAAALALGAS